MTDVTRSAKTGLTRAASGVANVSRAAWNRLAPETRDFLVTLAMAAVGLSVPAALAGYLALEAADPLNRALGVVMLAILAWFATKGLGQENKRRKRLRNRRRYKDW